LDIVEGSAPSETKEGITTRTNNSLRALNVKALTILGTFGRINRRKMMVINLDRLVMSGLQEGATGAVKE
jgi:hypothetical protein